MGEQGFSVRTHLWYIADFQSNPGKGKGTGTSAQCRQGRVALVVSMVDRLNLDFRQGRFVKVLLFFQIGNSSEQQFGPNFSFFEHYDIMVQFVRQFFGRPINGHLRKTSRDLHKRDVIFVILSLSLLKPTHFFNKSCSILGQKLLFWRLKRP